jgi:hypothetical protein
MRCIGSVVTACDQKGGDEARDLEFLGQPGCFRVIVFFYYPALFQYVSAFPWVSRLPWRRLLNNHRIHGRGTNFTDD